MGEFHNSVLPTGPIHVAFYLTHLLQTGASKHPVNNAIYAIKWAHNCAGLLFKRLQEGKLTMVYTKRNQSPKTNNYTL